MASMAARSYLQGPRQWVQQLKEQIQSEHEVQQVLQDHDDFRKWRQARLVFWKYVVILTFFLAICFMLWSGFKGSVMHVVSQVTHLLMCLQALLIYLLRNASFQSGISSRRKEAFARAEGCMLALFHGHYMFYVTLTWGRLRKLMVFAFGPQVQEQEDPFGESYGLMYAMFGLSLAAHCHALSTRSLMFLSVYAPLQWALQCLLLGTALDLTTWLQLAMVFMAYCSIAFLGGLRSNSDHLGAYSHLCKERRWVREAFSTASVPIFIVGRRFGEAKSLQLELWNRALEELTQVKVPGGTMLQDVACLQHGASQALLRAVQQALSDAAVRTRRMLVPIASLAGVVWLQVDVSPASEETAVVIGSDVTDFVSRHSSLLHYVPEHYPGEQSRGGKACEGCSAVLQPSSFVVLDCSPQFNISMQRRMRGRFFLQHVRQRDRDVVRAAASAVLAGERRPPFVVYLQEPEGRGRAGPERSVALRLSLLLEEGGLKLEISSGARGNAARLSDPGAEVEEHSPPLSRRAQSEVLAAAAPVPVPESRPRRAHPRARQAAYTPPPVVPDVDILLIILLDLARHFNLPSLEQCQALLLHVVRLIDPENPQHQARWGGPCKGWRCSLCRAGNDLDDEVCEVCQQGGPEMQTCVVTL